MRQDKRSYSALAPKGKTKADTLTSVYVTNERVGVLPQKLQTPNSSTQATTSIDDVLPPGQQLPVLEFGHKKRANKSPF